MKTTNGQFQKGNIPWNKGRTGVYSKEVLKKMGASKKKPLPMCLVCGKAVNSHGNKYCSSKCFGIAHRKGEFRKCIQCGKKFYAKRKDIKRGWGKFCSHKCWYNSPKTLEHRENLSEWQRGSKSPKWRGGISKTLTQEYGRYKWQLLRKSVFERDNYTCQKCMKKCYKGELDCHHIVPYRRAIKQRFAFWNVGVNDIGNLISLCKSCHKKQDNEIQKQEERGNYGLAAILHTVS